MSGIFGLLRLDGQPVEPRDIDRMGTMLAHRGPDGRRRAVEGGMAMGHCLMRVNREDWFEAQPIQDGDVTIVADARIDNREALAAEIGMADAALRDMPDSAVLLAAYRHWGEDVASHLIGDFAFAIWDARARTLLLGRDHMGQRGLYYHHGDGFLAFASEVKALWAVAGVPRRLSEAGIGRRILGPIDLPPGETIYDSICALPGGTTLHLGADGTLSQRVYWEPHASPAHLGHDEAYYLDAYRAVVTEAVVCRVRRLGQAPALCFSGGFDSGSIAAIAGPIVAEKGRRIVAVASVLGEGERRMVGDARDAVEAFRPFPYLDLRHYVRGDEGMFTDIEAAFLATDDNAGNPHVRRGMYRIAASAGARVVLDGHGGDYTVNNAGGALLGRILRRGKPGRFVREFRMRVRATGASWRAVLRHEVIPALLPVQGINAAWRAAATWRDRPINPAFAEALRMGGAIDFGRLRYSRVRHHRWRDASLHLLRKVAQSQPLHATLAAADGLELSRPFHDKRIVELGLAIPESLDFRNGLERYLARQAFADILPEPLLKRRPGNDAEQPDMFRMVKEGAPAALAEARRRDQSGRLSRYLDLDRIDRMIADADERNRPDHATLYLAARMTTLARFIGWFESRND
jgi:asparagine synthase (glutamine-hydrolysing)